MIKTAEEVAQKVVSEYTGSVMGMYVKMMEIYAKQEAIEFSEWIDRERWLCILHTNKWFQGAIDKSITTSELFLRYLQSKTNQL